MLSLPTLIPNTQMKQNQDRWPVFDNSQHPYVKSVQDGLQPQRKVSDIFEEMSGMVTLRRKAKENGSHSPSPAMGSISPPPPLPPPNSQQLLTSW